VYCLKETPLKLYLDGYWDPNLDIVINYAILPKNLYKLYVNAKSIWNELWYRPMSVDTYCIRAYYMKYLCCHNGPCLNLAAVMSFFGWLIFLFDIISSLRALFMFWKIYLLERGQLPKIQGWKLFQGDKKFAEIFQGQKALWQFRTPCWHWPSRRDSLKLPTTRSYIGEKYKIE